MSYRHKTPAIRYQIRCEREKKETLTITKDQLADAILWGYDHADGAGHDNPDTAWYEDCTEETWKRLGGQ